MSEPRIAAKMPKVVELEAGRHAWCACGQSANQPFCDGSHAGSDFTPMVFTLDEKKRVALCQCKHSGGPPFCDGTHAGL